MRKHKDDYTPFLDVLPGGATRRNPKRKNAGGYSSFSAEIPTPEEVDRAFEERLSRMSRGGTYGDNMEIVAFTNAYLVDVIVMQTEERFYIAGPPISSEKQICCIAYHVSLLFCPPPLSQMRCLIETDMGALFLYQEYQWSTQRTTAA